MTTGALVVATIFAGLLGLAVGSFLNVVIYRVPAGESIVRPPSHCPHCGHEIRPWHNVPVAGWLVLRGKCADCRAPISVRYPLVELATGALFAAVTALLLHRHLGAALPAYLYFVAIGVALTMIDLDHRRLPNQIVLPSYPVLVVLLVIASAVRGEWGDLARAGAGAAMLLAFYFLLVLAYPAGMGVGDLKLSGLLGLVLGYLSWTALVVGGFGSFLLGTVGAVALLARRRANRKTAIPFGPFMIIATGVAIFVAHPVADAYRHLLGR